MDGIICIYKEKGYTSHDVVAKLRGILKTKKIGHTGTLDPDATGVLPVCIGKATKLCDMLTDKDKAYRTEMVLGKKTDTQDISGKVIEESVLGNDITEERIKDVIYGFVGDYMQIPPMYSALKVNGRKLYELARQGIEVERKPRPVKILEVDVQKIEIPYITMTVDCSKGTYIRTLCNDIGERLGTGACMTQLERIRSGRFGLKDCITLEKTEEFVKNGTIGKYIISVDDMFKDLKKCVVIAKYNKLVQNGNALLIRHLNKTGQFKDGERVRVYDENGMFAGIYAFKASEGVFAPVKMFFI